MGNEEVENAGTQLVVKDNRLIQNIFRETKNHKKYNLTANEQKALAYIVSKIKKPEKGVKPQYKYTLDVKEFCEICNIEYKSGGGNTSYLEETLGKLASNGIWITNRENERMYFTWIVTPKIDLSKKKITVTIPEDSMPYLYDLHDNFTQYELNQMLCLKGKYSLALFELLQSNAYKECFRISIQDYRDYVGLEDNNYKQFKELKRCVIDRPLKEINEKPTGIYAEYTPIRSGRFYRELEFHVKEKNVFEQYNAKRKQEEERNRKKEQRKSSKRERMS